nr:hypothetical protein [Tanacetum cinerariifolium]
MLFDCHNLHQQCKLFSRGNSSTRQWEHFFTSSGKIVLAVGTILHYQWELLLAVGTHHWKWENYTRNIDSFNDIHPYFNDDPLSGSTTYSSNSLLEEFTDELALITYPLDYDDNLTCDIESDLREIEFLLYQGEDFVFKDSIDQTDLANLDDLFVDTTPEIGKMGMSGDSHGLLLFVCEQPAKHSDSMYQGKRKTTIGSVRLIIDSGKMGMSGDSHGLLPFVCEQPAKHSDSMYQGKRKTTIGERKPRKGQNGIKTEQKGKRGEAGKSQKQLQSKRKKN